MSMTEVTNKELEKARKFAYKAKWMPGSPSGDQHLYVKSGRRYLSLCGWYVRSEARLPDEPHGHTVCRKCKTFEKIDGFKVIKALLVDTPSH